jgi:hypothetical protein
MTRGDGGGATCGGYNQLPCGDNGNDNGGDGSDDETNCDGSGLIDQYCVDLSAEDAQDLENFLDGPGNIGTATGFAGLVIDLGSLVAWANLSAFQKAIIIALIGGADVPIALVGMILSGALLVVGVETNALSENLSDSGITQTGGTLTVSTNLLYDIYELQTPSGKTYTSISVVQFPVGVKVTSTMIYGWLSFRNGSPYSWDW